MSIRTSIGWQTMLADLSLILFMVTAAAMADQPPPPKPAAPPPKPALVDPARAEPLALWREAAGAPSIAAWLTSQQPDPRQQLTITLHYAPGAEQAAMRHAIALAGDAARAGGVGARARLLLEPSASPGTQQAVATLAYDRAPAP
ncbi:hypothetical protein GTZ99_13120 [Novosphingobium sp. FSY-8]|uniref:Uncharacterized protein n=1 Tax=Novosphingobium ovatum TaxID=1908523 RepID=A0ABW9XG23_9SPHN|nr:hypothetical protein [Novosphingobium ovatum]NBC37490.1 hypothetical protein [Novosphingobium ovatum]